MFIFFSLSMFILRNIESKVIGSHQIIKSERQVIKAFLKVFSKDIEVKSKAKYYMLRIKHYSSR